MTNNNFFQKKDERILFTKDDFFWRIVGYLEQNIVFFWSHGNLGIAFEHMKQLWLAIVGHIHDENDVKKVEQQLKEIKNLIYDITSLGDDYYNRGRRWENEAKANQMMFDTYKEIKRLKIKWHMELPYGIPKWQKQEKRKRDNLRKILGDDFDETIHQNKQ